MNAHLLKIILTGMALTLIGCVRTVTTAPYSSTRNRGVVYALPRTLLRITVTYTVRETFQLTNGIPLTPTSEIFIAKPVVVEPVLAMDPDNQFVLSGEGLVKSGHLDSSFKFQLGEQPLLTSVSAETTDKGPEIFQGLVGSGISIAKMAAAAGEDLDTLPQPLKEIAKRLIEINASVAGLVGSNDEEKIKKLEALMKERDVLVAMASKYIEANTPRIKDTEATYSWVRDLKDFKQNETKDWVEIQLAAPEKKFGDFAAAEVPKITVGVQLSTPQFENVAKTHFCCENSPEEPGVIYRSPELARVRVTNQKTGVVFDDNIPFANVGAFNVVDVKTKVWAKRKTQIVFNPATGSIKEYGVEATSSAEAAAKALDTSLGKVNTAVGEIRKAQEAADATKKTPEQIKLAEFETQKKLVEAEAALLKAQQELDKVRADSGAK